MIFQTTYRRQFRVSGGWSVSRQLRAQGGHKDALPRQGHPHPHPHPLISGQWRPDNSPHVHTFGDVGGNANPARKATDMGGTCELLTDGGLCPESFFFFLINVTTQGDGMTECHWKTCCAFEHRLCARHVPDQCCSLVFLHNEVMIDLNGASGPLKYSGK